MTKYVVISGAIAPSAGDAVIGVEVWIDQHCVVNREHVDHAMVFEHSLDDSDGTHELRIVMKHKQAVHTRIDDQGMILQDAVLTVSDLKVDGIDVMRIVSKHSEYHHDFNGSQSLGTHPFHGVMGCNGTVSLKFTTPGYLWLLEFM